MAFSINSGISSFTFNKKGWQQVQQLVSDIVIKLRKCSCGFCCIMHYLLNKTTHITRLSQIFRTGHGLGMFCISRAHFLPLLSASLWPNSAQKSSPFGRSSTEFGFLTITRTLCVKLQIISNKETAFNGVILSQ